MVHMPGANHNEAEVASAMKGYLADQKSVLLFEPNAHGNSYMAHFVAHGKLDDIHNELLKDGVTFHTLEPKIGGAEVDVFGTDQEMLNNVSKAAQHYGSTVDVTAGDGEFIGTHKEDGTDREQRDDARRVYETIIREADAAKNCRDATSERSGTAFALVGPPFRKK